MQIINFDAAKEYKGPIHDMIVIILIFGPNFKHAIHVALIDKAEDFVGNPSESWHDEINRALTTQIIPVCVN